MTLTIELTEELWARVEAEAARRNVPPETVARDCLLQALDAAGGSGLTGGDSDGSADAHFDQIRASLTAEYAELYQRLA